MERLFQEFKFATRLLWKDRGFASTAILTLALCIGANAAIFAVVNSVLLQPLPVPHAEQLVHMYNAYPGAGVDGRLDRRARLLRSAARDRRLPGTGALQHARRHARRQQGEPQRIIAMIAHAVAPAPAAGAAGPRPHLHRRRRRDRQDAQGGPDLRVVAAVVRRAGQRGRQRRADQRRAVHGRRRAAAGLRLPRSRRQGLDAGRVHAPRRNRTTRATATTGRTSRG